jgi:exodeoxyribonuclease VIII
MRDIMIDLETMGTRAGCALVSIGAVAFGPKGLGEEFYEVVNSASCKGLFVDVDTAAWWSKQSQEAREVLRLASRKASSLPLPKALWKFRAYVRGVSVDARVWGNGADFDLPILAAAYASIGEDAPWPPFNGRCYRTLKGLAREVKLERGGTHHNALDDAKTQALHLIKILKKLKLEVT